MASGWIDNGSVAVPARGVAYGAAIFVLGAGLVGGGIGFDAAWRRDGTTALTSTGPANRPGDLVAKPIVELAPPTAAPSESADDADDEANDQAKADAAAQTAAAQALQAKASAKGDIDSIMTSPSEKPPTPAKTGPDEAPPASAAPLRSDVPF